jgi:tetratricopeptide (TPR) repeat protein
LALGLLGTMNVNLSLASRLHDEDAAVNELAADALWSIWFRADSEENNRELQKLIRLDVSTETGDDVLAAFEGLLKKAPRFAEAYNQRAVVHFRLGDFGKAVLDCEKTLRLNPVHFGAASGMAQSFMKQRKLRAALRSYRRAYRINPRIDGISDVIDSLEKTLGEEGKR